MASFDNFYLIFGISVVLGTIIMFYLQSLFDRTPNPRQYNNKKILKLLSKYIKDNPDQRFGQILRNTGIAVDIEVKDSKLKEWDRGDYYWVRRIHEEPTETLARMNRVLKQWKR